MTRWPTYVDNAIREAHARGDKPTIVLSKLRAGTLVGLDGRQIAIKDRTFWNRWRKAKEEQRMAREARSVDEPRDPRSGVLARVTAIMTAERLETDDPEVIANATGLKVALVRDALLDKAQREAWLERQWLAAEEHRRKGELDRKRFLARGTGA